MSKIIELTVELDIQRVSCPGVWLCQDGHVRLSVFALGSTYQTCLLPPVFPLMYKDVFYFKKRFQENCALNNICCLLKDETIYCELVQWSEDCVSRQYVILAQYLGALNDILFPPNMCTNDGVDLLMRRSKNFPGILSPKIEIATKVRIDEVWSQCPTVKMSTCNCVPREEPIRQNKVCHSARYHRYRCNTRKVGSGSRSRSRSRSQSGSRSYCSDSQKVPTKSSHYCPTSTPTCRPSPCRSPTRSPQRSQLPRSHSCSRSPPRCRQYCVYNVQTSPTRKIPQSNKYKDLDDNDTRHTSKEYISDNSDERNHRLSDDRMQRILLESRYIDNEKSSNKIFSNKSRSNHKSTSLTPCVCEICKRYHQLFHTDALN